MEQLNVISVVLPWPSADPWWHRGEAVVSPSTRGPALKSRCGTVARRLRRDPSIRSCPLAGPLSCHQRGDGPWTFALGERLVLARAPRRHRECPGTSGGAGTRNWEANSARELTPNLA